MRLRRDDLLRVSVRRQTPMGHTGGGKQVTISQGFHWAFRLSVLFPSGG